MKNILLLAGLVFSVSAISQDTLYYEGFEGFAVGDFVSDSPVWATWDNAPGSLTDAQITDEQAHEGANSLKIYAGSPAGGPMDVIMTAGLNEDIYDCSFWMYIPTGATGYFNLQEDQAPGVGWAYEVTFAGDGSIIVVADAVEVGSGSFPLDTWFHVSNLMDMDSDNVTVSVDGTTVGNFMFDSPFGAINFYAAGDGVSLPTYYVDDYMIATATASSVAEATNAIGFTFGPNPAANYINIQGQPSDATLRIHALNGQLVLEQNMTSLDRGARVELDLDNGIYFVELVSGTQRTTQRLVISQ
jgi:hypothetical protein